MDKPGTLVGWWTVTAYPPVQCITTDRLSAAFLYECNEIHITTSLFLNPQVDHERAQANGTVRVRQAREVNSIAFIHLVFFKECNENIHLLLTLFSHVGFTFCYF